MIKAFIHINQNQVLENMDTMSHEAGTKGSLIEQLKPSWLRKAFYDIFSLEMLPQHFSAACPQTLLFWKDRRISLIDRLIDLSIHSHLDFKALIGAVNTCEPLLLLSALHQQLIDTTTESFLHCI